MFVWQYYCNTASGWDKSQLYQHTQHVLLDPETAKELEIRDPDGKIQLQKSKADCDDDMKSFIEQFKNFSKATQETNFVTQSG
jgi:hypothetical protein